VNRADAALRAAAMWSDLVEAERMRLSWPWTPSKGSTSPALTSDPTAVGSTFTVGPLLESCVQGPTAGSPSTAGGSSPGGSQAGAAGPGPPERVAIALDAIHPEIRQALALPLGGVGIGDQHSFAQYLANQLSAHIRGDPSHFPVEGAFLSNQHVEAMSFDGPDGPMPASFLENGADLSMFRRRAGA
jgi:hypothetical protein